MGNEQFKPTIEALVRQSALSPQEQVAKVRKTEQSLIIGIPVEKELQEKRICLTPQSVGLLTNNGHQVVVESGAGSGANFSDRAYSEKGAKIVYSSKEVFESPVVLKVEPPTAEELEMMKPNSTLISALQMSTLNPELIASVNKKKLTGIGFELIEDKGGLKPIVRSMSEIASYSIISIASELLSKVKDGGMGVIFGGVTGVPPLKIVILGAGTIGENVARAALAMGASIRVFDNHHYKLRRLKKDLGQEVYTAIVDPETLALELKDADVVIGALRSEEGTSLCVVSEEMVASMKPNSVIIDASISQGGCFETSRVTSHEAPTFIKHDVIHYCVPNIGARVSRTSSRALSYLWTPILLQVAQNGGVENMMASKNWFMKGVYSYKGYLTNANIARKFGVQFKDLELLLCGRM